MDVATIAIATVTILAVGAGWLAITIIAAVKSDNITDIWEDDEW